MSLQGLISSAVLSLSCLAVSAVPYADLQLPDKKVTAGTSQWHHEGTFDLNDPGSTTASDWRTTAAGWLGYQDIDGFNPDTMDATSGFVEFLLIDHNFDYGVEKFRVNLDDALLVAARSFKFADWIVRRISAQLLLEISETGILEYDVQATSGSFTLVGAYLEINGVHEGPVTAVPDGGITVGFLGLGLVSLVAVKRLRSK